MPFFFSLAAIGFCKTCHITGHPCRTRGRIPCASRWRLGAENQIEAWSRFFWLTMESVVVSSSFIFTPEKVGKMKPFWPAYFSKGLVQPRSKDRLWWILMNFLKWLMKNMLETISWLGGDSKGEICHVAFFFASQASLSPALLAD